MYASTWALQPWMKNVITSRLAFWHLQSTCCQHTRVRLTCTGYHTAIVVCHSVKTVIFQLEKTWIFAKNYFLSSRTIRLVPCTVPLALWIDSAGAHWISKNKHGYFSFTACLNVFSAKLLSQKSFLPFYSTAWKMTAFAYKYIASLETWKVGKKQQFSCSWRLLLHF